MLDLYDVADRLPPEKTQEARSQRKVPEKENRPRAEREASEKPSPERTAFDVVWRAVRRHFDVVAFFWKYEPTTKAGSGESVQCFCPFNDKHGTKDDDKKTPVFITNPEDSDHGTATVSCPHDTCKHIKKRPAADYAFAVFARKKLTIDDLRPFLDEEGLARLDAITLDLDGAIEALTSDSDDDAYNRVIRAAAMQTKVRSALAPIAKRIARKLGRNANDVTKELKDAHSEAHARSSNDDEAFPSAVYPKMDFTTAVAKATVLFEANNEAKPHVYWSTVGASYVRIDPGRSDVGFDELSSDPKWQHEIRRYVDVRQINQKLGNHSIPPTKELIAAFRGNPALAAPTCGGIARAPLFAADGALRTAEGYDAGTQTYLKPWGAFLPVPDVVSDDDVTAANAIIELALRDFPFSDVFGGADPEPLRVSGDVDAEGFPMPNYQRGAASRANAVAAVFIEPCVRHLIKGPTPLNFIDKPKPGTGAGFLLDLQSQIHEGCLAATDTPGKDEVELHKQVTSKLKSGRRIVVFDNFNHELQSAALAAAATASVWLGRILGKSEDANVPIKATWMFAANTGKLSPELMERALPIRLDAATDNPARDRPPEFYKLNTLGHTFASWCEANKLELLRAVHVLVRWWFQECAAGYEYRGPRHPRFGGDYSTIVGGVLDCAGIEGFLENYSTYLDTRQDEKDVIAITLQLLFDRFANDNGAFTASDAAGFLALSNGELLDTILGPTARVFGDEEAKAAARARGVGVWLTGVCKGGTYRLEHGTVVTIESKTVNGAKHYVLRAAQA